MTDKLPPNLLALFAPRPPLRWVPPSDHAPEERKTAHISGIAAFLPQLQEYKETDEYTPTESWLQRKDRIKLEKKQRQEKLLKDGPLSCEGAPTCFDYLYLHLSDFWAPVLHCLHDGLTFYDLQTNLQRIQTFAEMLSRLLLLHD
jgi:hypothetical protein